jgi:hypothetical protein
MGSQSWLDFQDFRNLQWPHDRVKLTYELQRFK